MAIIDINPCQPLQFHSNLSLPLLQKRYKAGLVEMANKGYNLKANAIPIVAAKSGTIIASNVSWKTFSALMQCNIY